MVWISALTEIFICILISRFIYSFIFFNFSCFEHIESLSVILWYYKFYVPILTLPILDPHPFSRSNLHWIQPCNKNFNDRVTTKFKSQIRQDPCLAIHVWFALVAIGFCPHNYNISIDSFTCVKSFDDFIYICKTCDTKWKIRYLAKLSVTNLVQSYCQRDSELDASFTKAYFV